MSKVVSWGGITKLPLPPDVILEKAKGRYDRVIVIGVDSDGSQTIHSSEADMIVCNFDLDRAKAWIMREVMEINE